MPRGSPYNFVRLLETTKAAEMPPLFVDSFRNLQLAFKIKQSFAPESMHPTEPSLCNLQQVEHGIDPCHVLEGEVLVIEHHPLLALFHGHLLDVWKERNGDYHFPAICQAHQHLASMGSEIQILNA